MTDEDLKTMIRPDLILLSSLTFTRSFRFSTFTKAARLKAVIRHASFVTRHQHEPPVTDSQPCNFQQQYIENNMWTNNMP